MTIYSFDLLLFLFGTMSSSNCCFLTCIQISQEAGQVVWYSHLFQNFPQFLVIHTVNGFGIVNKAEIDVFLALSCLFTDPTMLAIWSLVPLLFLNPAWTSESSWSTYCWNLAWRLLSITLLACATQQHTCFVRAHGAFTKIDYILSHKKSLNKFRKDSSHVKYVLTIMELS